MRRLILAASSFLTLAACKGPPARLVAGRADTVIVNNQRPVQLPMRVLDAAGHHLDSSGVRYQWTDGVPVSVSATGVVTCTQAGDAAVRASLGRLTTRVLVRCRPVRDVRAPWMLELVVGGPPQDIPFEALDADGQPVTLLSGEVTVGDSTIATLDGMRVTPRAPGRTEVTMRVGDRRGWTSVSVYEPGSTPEGLRPGQRLAVPLRLSGGEMRRWRISASREVYFFAILPDDNAYPMPALAIVGANCSPGGGPQRYYCLAQHDASIIVYHPQNVDPSRELRGTLAVWRQDWH
jgi:hypothetical protein